MKLLDAALGYARRGWPVFPIRPNEKRPATENGFLDASLDPVTIERFWLGRSGWQERNIGVVTSRVSGIVVVDADIDKETGEFGEDTLENLQAVHGRLPACPVQRTPKGGKHYFFRYPDDGQDLPRRIRFAPGLDCLGSRMEEGREIAGYLLVAPSKRMEGAYEWLVGPDECPVPEMPEWLRRLVREDLEKRERPADMPRYMPDFSGGNNAYGLKALRDICSAVANASPSNQMKTLFPSAVRIGSLAGGGNLDWSEAERALVSAGMQMRNGDPHDPWTEKVIRKNVQKGMKLGAADPTRVEARNYERPRKNEGLRYDENMPPPLGEVVDEPAYSETAEMAEPQDEIVEADGGRDDKAAKGHVRLVVDNQEKPKAKKKPKQAEWKGREWMDGLEWILNDEGGLKASSLKNVQNFCRHHPDLKSLFWYNSFADEIMVEGPLPGDMAVGKYPRSLADQDETALACWLNAAGLSPSISMTAATLREAAFLNSRDPFLEWAGGLKWDGRRRIDTWLTYYGGAEDNEYTRLVGRRFLMSAMARGLDPGCKVDTMMILEGPQGLKKSTLVKVLCGNDWFSDQVGEIHGKDASQAVQGIWIMEIPEMDKFQKAEANAVKAFLSRLFDRYRPPYGRNFVRRERRCVFFGTINPDGAGYFTDKTGARRFLPVQVVSIDIDGLIADRDQLWAEAKAAYESGERYWIDTDEKHIVEPEQEKRRDEDVWETRILDWLDDRNYGWKVDANRAWKAFTSGDVMWLCLNIDLKSQKQADKKRVATILKMFGCEQVQHKNGIKGRSWEYEARKNEDNI